MLNEKCKIKNLVIGICLVIGIWLLVILNGCAGPSSTTTKIGSATLTVSIRPDPPKVGENTLTVKLMDASGKAVTDAAIRITAIMPAMPSMGMPEMRGEGEVEVRGESYIAKVPLSMEGNWTLMVEIKSTEISGRVGYALTTGSKGLVLKENSFEEEKMESLREETAGGVKITAEKQQLIGVKTEIAQKRQLLKKIRTAGRIAYDPQLYTSQSEYLEALSLGDESLIEAARIRLLILGMSEGQIKELATQEKPDANLLLAGENVWLYASIYEYDLPLIKVGQQVRITSAANPGKEFAGELSSINPIFDPDTRTTKIRAKISNLSDALRPEMFVNAEIDADLGLRLAVSRDAVLDSGKRQIIFVDRGNGYFEPREVKIGHRVDPYVEVQSGIYEGEKIVTSGNFLIDSESRLKSAFSSM